MSFWPGRVPWRRHRGHSPRRAASPPASFARSSLRCFSFPVSWCPPWTVGSAFLLPETDDCVGNGRPEGCMLPLRICQLHAGAYLIRIARVFRKPPFVIHLPRHRALAGALRSGSPELQSRLRRLRVRAGPSRQQISGSSSTIPARATPEPHRRGQQAMPERNSRHPGSRR